MRNSVFLEKQNNYRVLFFLTFFLLPLTPKLPALALGGMRWWQREELKPSENQTINPTYLQKKRDLERAWDQYLKNVHQEAHFRSMGQKTSALRGAVRDSYRIVLELEESLAKIPSYVMKESDRKTEVTLDSMSLHRSPVSSYVRYVKLDSSDYPYKQLVRISFHPFPYVRDPAGVDVGSFEQLGDLSAYVVRIYTATSINENIKKKKAVQDAFGKDIPVYLRSEQYGLMLATAPKSLLEARSAELLLNKFKENIPLEIIIDAENLPEYIYIPLPQGNYYFEYSLLFLRATKSNHKRVHPNYPGRHAFLKGLHDVCWAPPMVSVKYNQIAEIEFLPTMNINFYDYPIHPIKEDNWEGSNAFMHWLEYLEWTGEWLGDDLEKKENKSLKDIF